CRGDGFSDWSEPSWHMPRTPGGERGTMTLFRTCVAGVAGVLLVSCVAHISGTPAPQPMAARLHGSGIKRIQHVIVIDQENHSFDNYFGTYPGADGIPMRHGVPSVCIAAPSLRGCLRPFYDPSLRGVGGPHSHAAAIRDVAGGK